MPNDELAALCRRAEAAAADRCLEAQVRRMLKDPKAFALVENFGGNGCERERSNPCTGPHEVSRVYRLHSNVNEKETVSLRAHSRRDRSILDFIDADYTFLNPCGWPSFTKDPRRQGHAFRKGDLTGSQRGGVLTQASVLTVSSYANRTSPVLRGKWIPRTFSTPPPPRRRRMPRAWTNRRSEKNRFPPRATGKASVQCHFASCHARMDPLGFALEHFDAIGNWRDKDGAFAIDTAGTTPDGRLSRITRSFGLC